LQRKIGLKKSLEIIYNLEFTGFIQLERIWWWRNYIEYIKYQEIIYPKHGFISVVRLNQTHKHPNTIRVLTNKQANSGKRELACIKINYMERKKKTMNEKEISKKIGKVLSTREIMLGIKHRQKLQKNLQEATFQQVQKYEKGMDRVPFPKLVYLFKSLET
jgi:uncharacterized HAD superfamily protein